MVNLHTYEIHNNDAQSLLFARVIYHYTFPPSLEIYHDHCWVQCVQQLISHPNLIRHHVRLGKWKQPKYPGMNNCFKMELDKYVRKQAFIVILLRGQLVDLKRITFLLWPNTTTRSIIGYGLLLLTHCKSQFSCPKIFLEAPYAYYTTVTLYIHIMWRCTTFHSLDTNQTSLWWSSCSAIIKELVRT